MLLKVTVKPIVSPALMGLASADFSTFRSGQLTVTEAEAELLVKVSEASLVAEAEAEFDTVPQLAAEVVAVMCTVEELPAASVVGAYCSELPTIDHPALAGVIVQLKPLGSVSVKVRPVALPAPMLLSVTSNPMTSPADTGPIGLATFCTLTSGHCTTIDAEPVLLP